MRWLITGGCGFIGRCLASSLYEAGSHSLRVLDNLEVGTAEALASVLPLRRATLSTLDWGASEGAELIVADIRDGEALDEAAEGAEVLVHLAANTGVGPSVEDPEHDCRVNVLGTLNALEAARNRRVARFVFASSGAPLGEQTPPIHEGLAPRPVSPYGASKLAGEGYCSAYHGSFGVDTVCLRFGNVYGPLSNHKSSVVAKFIRRAMEGHPLEIYGDGKQTRDYIYVEDLVAAIVKAASVDGVAGEVFQIATHRETTVNELVALLVMVLRDAGVDGVRWTNAPPRVGEVTRNYSDVSKARRVLGWEPGTALRDGLARTVAWFLEHRVDVGSLPE